MTLIDALRGRLVSSVSTSACQIARLPGDTRVRKAHRNRTHDLYTEDFHASHQPRRISNLNAFHGTRCTAAHGTRYLHRKALVGVFREPPTPLMLLYSILVSSNRLCTFPSKKVENSFLSSHVNLRQSNPTTNTQQRTSAEGRRHGRSSRGQPTVPNAGKTGALRATQSGCTVTISVRRAERHCGERRKRGNHSPTTTKQGGTQYVSSPLSGTARCNHAAAGTRYQDCSLGT